MVVNAIFQIEPVSRDDSFNHFPAPGGPCTGINGLPGNTEIEKNFPIDE